MNNSIRFVPFSVKMRKAGYVRNPIQCWSLSVPKWIPAPPPSPVVDMAKVDHVVDVLSRFVATWVAQSRTARREYRVREAGRKWRDSVMADNWGDMVVVHERREAAARRQVFENYCSMPEEQWRAVARALIAARKDATADMMPLIRGTLTPVWQERDRRAAMTVVEVAQIWTELNVQPRLHNQQRPAQIRVVRPRNRFDTGSDSE